MKKLGFRALVLVLGFAAAGAVQAGDVERGKGLASSCVACHGAGGISPAPAMFPDLAGRSADTLAEQLHAFRSGERENAMMSPQAARLSDQDISDLAAYFASQPGR